LDSEQGRRIGPLVSSGVAPAKILSSLKKSDPTLATNQDLYNFKKKFVHDLLDGKSTLEYVMNDLANSPEQWIYDTLIASNGTLEGLFFAHPKSVKLARHFHHVCLLDCTYKTNVY